MVSRQEDRQGRRPPTQAAHTADRALQGLRHGRRHAQPIPLPALYRAQQIWIQPTH